MESDGGRGDGDEVSGESDEGRGVGSGGSGEGERGKDGERDEAKVEVKVESQRGERVSYPLQSYAYVITDR